MRSLPKKTLRPVVLSLGGFDPCGGAGVLADVKTFEMNKVYGLAVNTCITIQNDKTFISAKWENRKSISLALQILAKRYSVRSAKLGMHKNIEEVLFNVKLLKKIWPHIIIVWDPVMVTSSGYDLNINVNKSTLKNILSKINLVTPNILELEKIRTYTGGKLFLKCAYLVKGGHSKEKFSEDILFEKGKAIKKYKSKRILNGEKHGSGCVLSSAIAANLAKGNNLSVSIKKAKKYINKFLGSSDCLNGYHN